MMVTELWMHLQRLLNGLALSNCAFWQDGTLCASNGEMTPEHFECAMRQQLVAYVQVLAVSLEVIMSCRLC